MSMIAALPSKKVYPAPKKLSEAEYEGIMRAQKAHAETRMHNVDSMPKQIRELIYDFNVNPVVELFNMGLQESAEIREVLELRAKEGDKAARERAVELLKAKGLR